MHVLIIYQLKKSLRWRWKLNYNHRTLARADYHYESPAAARRAFMGLVKALNNKIEFLLLKEAADKEKPKENY